MSFRRDAIGIAGGGIFAVLDLATRLKAPRKRCRVTIPRLEREFVLLGHHRGKFLHHFMPGVDFLDERRNQYRQDQNDYAADYRALHIFLALKTKRTRSDAYAIHRSFARFVTYIFPINFAFQAAVLYSNIFMQI